MAADPTSSSITLILKCSTTTLFLFTTPTSTILSVKQQLISMLESNSKHLPECLQQSIDSDNIIFGIPRDTNDLKKGFLELDKPKGLAGNKTTVSNAGLKDGGVYAFRISKGGDDDEDDDDDDDDEDFDVQFPVDDYGESQK